MPTQLETSRTSPQEKAQKVFSRTAEQYDLLNNLMSFGLDMYWRKKLVEASALMGNEKILDIGTGTGALVFDILKKYPEVEIAGLDPVPQMLQVAQVRAHQISAKAKISFKDGVVEELPFPNQSFDRIVTAFTLRNFTNREKAFREIARTLRKNGTFVSLELTRPKNSLLRFLHKIYVQSTIPLYGRLISDREAYRYLAKTVLSFPEPEVIAHELRSCGFPNVKVQPLTFGITTLHYATR